MLPKDLWRANLPAIGMEQLYGAQMTVRLPNRHAKFMETSRNGCGKKRMRHRCGTPRLIANQSQQVVWRWDNDDPFGGNMGNANPSGLGTFEFNLRFPGQYFDKETNQHYNYYRDYSPEIGRYIESDPIGLRGGLNTYAYTDSDPLRFTDPLGLQSGSDVLGERPRPPVGWPNVSQEAQQRLAQQLEQLWNNIVNQSNDELERCKQDCEADRKRDQDDCEWWWKMRGRNAEDYRRCQRAADEQLMKCYDNCRKTCK